MGGGILERELVMRVRHGLAGASRCAPAAGLRAPVVAAIAVAAIVGATAALGIGHRAAGVATAARPDPAPCPGNLLVNPGFEEGVQQGPRAEERVPIGWSPWFATVPGVDGLNYPPHFQPRRARAGDDEAGGRRVGLGVWSAEISTDDATHTGGLWQRVAVPAGSQILARAWVYAWATNGDKEAFSEPPGTYAYTLGIDPRGGEDPNGEAVSWTSPITITDAWQPLVVESVSERSVVTLFSRGQPLRILRHNVSRWDGMCLQVLGPAGEPTGTATRLPWPTLTPITPVPTVTEDPAIAASRLQGLALSVAVEATARAESLGEVPDPAATISAAATRIARGGVAATGADRGADDDPAASVEPTRAERALATLIDQSGWAAFALAALVGSWLFGIAYVEGAR